MQLSLLDFIRSLGSNDPVAATTQNETKSNDKKHYPLRGMSIQIEPDFDGTVGVTIAFNVPQNNALAIADLSSTEGAKLWAKYLTDWTFWNHARTVTALIAAALFMLAKPLY